MMHGTTNIKSIDAQQANLFTSISTPRVLLMMGEIVSRNMWSKAIANKKRICCILLDLFHHYRQYEVAAYRYFSIITFFIFFRLYFLLHVYMVVFLFNAVIL